jgi:hypothetical protein
MDAKLLEYQARAADWQTAAQDLERLALNSLSLEQVRMAINTLAWVFAERVKWLNNLAAQRRVELGEETAAAIVVQAKKRPGRRAAH